jgi:hypothetical protein
MSLRFITVPELFMIAATRAALGAGVGLLLGERLSAEQRRAVGWTLLAVGVISTVPLAAEVLLRSESSEEPWRPEEQRLRGNVELPSRAAVTP